MSNLKRTAKWTLAASFLGCVLLSDALARPEPVQNFKCQYERCGYAIGSDQCENSCISDDPDETHPICNPNRNFACQQNFDQMEFCYGKCYPTNESCGSLGNISCEGAQ